MEHFSSIECICVLVVSRECRTINAQSMHKALILSVGLDQLSHAYLWCLVANVLSES